MTQLGPLKEKFAEAKYEAEASFGEYANCYHGFATHLQTEVCDEDDCEQVECPDQDELIGELDNMITNQFQTGEVWGEIVANMFQNGRAPQRGE